MHDNNVKSAHRDAKTARALAAVADPGFLERGAGWRVAEGHERGGAWGSGEGHSPSPEKF